MKVIYKYELKSKCQFEMPKTAEIIYVNYQKGGIFMWAMVDTEKETQTRSFIIVGTGHQIKEDCISSIGSVMSPAGDFVFHVFEVINK